jgi:alpha-galactosidase
MQHLRQRFPGLIIENCAAGGHRFDYGMMRFARVTWTSDVTEPSWLVRYHLFGASHAYPAQYLTTWYIRSTRDVELAGATPAQLDALFRSRMLGAFGISDTLSTWSGELAASARRSVALYKRLRRYLAGVQAWLTPPPPVVGPALNEPQEWDATQYWLPETGESAVFAFRSAAKSSELLLRPRYLDPKQGYEVWDEDGRMKRRSASGRELTESGISVSVPELHSSAIVYLRRK